MKYKDIYFSKNTYLAFLLSSISYKNAAENCGLNIIENDLNVIIEQINKKTILSILFLYITELRLKKKSCMCTLTRVICLIRQLKII